MNEIPLWVCHRCQMIGSQSQALIHHENMGHDVIELSAEVSSAVRAEWGKARRPHFDVGALIAFSRKDEGRP